ncbi:MAG: EamA family transporter, partial [Chloroflexota bacterium]
MADSSYRTGVIFILIAALAYASVPIFARALYATGLDAVDVLTWRFGVAAPLMWLLVRLRRSHGPVDPMSARQRWILLSLGALYGSITLVV